MKAVVNNGPRDVSVSRSSIRRAPRGARGRRDLRLEDMSAAAGSSRTPRGHDAHLGGQVAAALEKNAGMLFGKRTIEKLDGIASKPSE